MNAGRVLREPLLYFLAIGAALFGVYHLLGKESAPSAATVVVTRKQIDLAVQTFERTYQHPPTPVDRRRLIDDLVRSEIMYREGVALGLDRDDLVIQSRVVQKLELLMAEERAPPDPSDADLQRYLDAHAERYMLAPRLSFRQVFLTPGPRDVSARSAQLLGELKRLRDSDAAVGKGDATQLAFKLDNAATVDVARDFGGSFVDELLQLPQGQWSGPVPSAYGLHLVLVGAREAARKPTLAEARQAVERDWFREQQANTSLRIYEQTRRHYRVSIIDTPARTAK